MNSLIEVIKISKALKATSLKGRNSLRLKRIFVPDIADSGNRRQRFLLFSYLDFRVCLHVKLQNPSKWFAWLVFGFNSSIQAFILRKSRPRAFFVVPWSSKRDRGWNWAHNWLNLLTSCGPNLEGIGSDVIFCEFLLFFSRISVQI